VATAGDDSGPSGARSGSAPAIPFPLALRLWFWIGLVSFGGPSGQIALLHGELVEKRAWLSERRFLGALDFCMLLPGPEAQQLATYCGWLLHGARGAVVAGALFVLPSAVLLFGLAWFYAAFGALDGVTAFFRAFEPAVVAIVAVSMVRLGRRALRGAASVAIALGALIGLRVGVPFPAIMGSAALIGIVGARYWPAHFSGALHGDAAPNDVDRFALSSAALRPTSMARALRMAVLMLILWWAPVAAVALVAGPAVFLDQGLFFSKSALVTFGGAYAVLPYIAEASVQTFGWATPEDVMVGLALAETTPGPLIMVTQWLGFLGAWNHPGELPPILAAAIGSALVTWVTFLPCFLFILVGAPYVEALRKVPALAGALRAVTAAALGAITHLALWFGTRALFTNGFAPKPLPIAAAAFFLYVLIARQWSMARIVGAACVLGVVLAFAETVTSAA